MNKNPDINWKFVLIGTAISIASGFLLKNNIKEPGMGLMLLGNIVMYYGFIADFFRFFDSTMENQNKPEITHVHNHYIYDTRSNVVEGVEQTDFRPDGSSTTTRHIKKWN